MNTTYYLSNYLYISIGVVDISTIPAYVRKYTSEENVRARIRTRVRARVT